MQKYLFYPENEDRLDTYLAEQLDFTRSRIRKLVEDKKILYNGEIVSKCGLKLNYGEIIVQIDEPIAVNAKPENIPLEILYQDNDIAVVNKPQGMVTHPCAGTPEGTLVNALMYHIKDLSGINGVLRPGIVHRLDKDTSGLLVVAKTDKAHLSLAKQIEERTMGRFYIALVCGNIKEDSGTISAPIARSRKDRKKMAVDILGREATTHFQVMERFGDFTLVEFELETGRTHQIRVHAKHIKHPVVGDITYGKKDEFGLNGQLLHSHKIVLRHPTSGEIMTFESELPIYFQKVLEKIRKKSNYNF